MPCRDGKMNPVSQGLLIVAATGHERNTPPKRGGSRRGGWRSGGLAAACHEAHGTQAGEH